MKFIIAFTVLIVISMSVKSAPGAPATCPEVFAKPFGSSKAEIGTVDALYPTDLKATNAAAAANALKQTKAARWFFFKPGEKVILFLKEVAANLEALLNKNEFKNDKLFDFINSEQRKTSEEGVEESYILNQNQSLIQGGVKTHTILPMLKVIQNAPNPKLIFGFLAFIADMAGCIQDKLQRKKFSPKQEVIVNIFVTHYKELEGASKVFYEKYSPDKYYNNSVQSKSKEKMYCFEKTEKKLDPADNIEKYKNIAKQDIRSGVMETGEVADKEARMPKGALSILKSSWQTIPKKLHEFCPKEPWAGHFSESFSEICMLLELFRKDNKKPIDKEKKEIISAVTAAFLISTGLHSAIEIVVPLKNYLQTDKFPPTIDLANAAKQADLKGKICGEGNVNSSTDYVSALIAKFSTTPKRRSQLK